MSLGRGSIGCMVLSLFLAGCTSDVLAPVETRTLETRPSSQASRASAPLEPINAPAQQISAVCVGGAVQVRAGDTLFGISRRCGVPLRALIDANDLRAPYTLAVGQSLRLPSVAVHTVAAGDTLYGISRQYGVDVSQLVQVNQLTEPYVIVPGQQLVLPGAGQITAPRIVEQPQQFILPVKRPQPLIIADDVPAAVAEVPSSSQTGVILPTKRPTPSQATETAQAQQPASASQSPEPLSPVAPPPSDGVALDFSWPLRGEIISRFGPKPGGQHNDGINIAAPANAAVRASESGTVAYAGDGLKGFGNLLLVRHKDGYVTAYAHNARLLAKRGDVVQKGQVIARVGQTGNVDTPQLHFEVRKGTQALDPRQVLDRIVF